MPQAVLPGGESASTKKYLNLGDQGQDVKNLQTYLNTQGNYGLAVDGDFGPLTDAALNDYNARSSDAGAVTPIAYTPKAKSIYDVAKGLGERDPALAATVASRGGTVSRAPAQDPNQQLLTNLSKKTTVQAAAEKLAWREPALASTVPGAGGAPPAPIVPTVAPQPTTAASLIPVMPTGIAEVQSFTQPTMQTLDTSAPAPLVTGEEPPLVEEPAAAVAGGGISTAAGGGAALGGTGGATPGYVAYGGAGGVGSVGTPQGGAETTDDEERRRVYEVQRRLQMAGIDAGPLDSMWGPRTEQGVRNFQQQVGLPVTGIADDAFNGALTRTLLQKQQAGGIPGMPGTTGAAPTAGTQDVRYVGGQVLVNGQPYTPPAGGGTAGAGGGAPQGGYPQAQPYVAPSMKIPAPGDIAASLYNTMYAGSVAAQQGVAQRQFDATLKLGMDALEKRMARKGMLRSGMTLRLGEELVATEGANLAAKLLDFEMAARDKAMQYGMQQWNTLTSQAMEQQRLSYQQWKDARDYTVAAYGAGLDEEEKKIQRAWDRVIALGRVDNDAALILGIAPGTLSYEAQKAKDEREHELVMQRNTIAAQQTQEKQYKDSIYYKLNNGIPLTPEEQTFVGTNPEANYMAKAITAAQKELDMWVTWGTLDPSDADYGEKRDQLIDLYYKKYTGEGATTAEGGDPQGLAQQDVQDAITAGADPATIKASIQAQRSIYESQGVDVDALLRYVDKAGR